jgi:cytochrome c55X
MRSFLLIGLVLSTHVWADVDNERQRQLLHLLKHDCGSCHGLTLKGGLGPPLLIENLKEKPDEMLALTILEGRPGTPMPPWKSLLTRDEVDWLVQQLRQGIE